MAVKRETLTSFAVTTMIGAVTIVAVWAGATRAAQLLAFTLLAVAVGRLMLPTSVVSPVRGRLWDSATLIILGIAVLYLSQWGDVTPV